MWRSRHHSNTLVIPSVLVLVSVLVCVCTVVVALSVIPCGLCVCTLVHSPRSYRPDEGTVLPQIDVPRCIRPFPAY